MTTGQLLELLGDPVDISDKIAMRRLEWLGHVVRMEDERMPKCLLLASMEETKPARGPRKRWRDCILSDVRARDALDTWFVTASSSRVEWRSLLSTPVRPVQQPEKIKCPECLRLFSRSRDIKRHKCTAERQKRIEDQRGSCRCTHCGRWFRSKGGLSVHRCCPPPSSHPLQRKPAASKRLPTRWLTASERAEIGFVCGCWRCFRQQQDLSHHRPFCKSSSAAP